MYYEINVSKNGSHYFATHKRSISYERKAITMYNEFLEKFPIQEGYRVSVTKYEELGEDVTLDFESKNDSND